MSRDLTTTVTGWPWLDRVTLPLWTIWCWWHRQRLYKTLGNGNPAAGRQMLAEAINTVYSPVVEAELVLLLEEHR